MKTVDGHVLAPLLTTMQQQGVAFPKGWSAMSKLRPSWQKQREQIEENLEQFVDRVGGWCVSEREMVPEFRVRWDEIEKEFEKEGGDATNQLCEDTVYEWQKKLDSYVVAPIDKYTGEMAVI